MMIQQYDQCSDDVHTALDNINSFYADFMSLDNWQGVVESNVEMNKYTLDRSLQVRSTHIASVIVNKDFLE